MLSLEAEEKGRRKQNEVTGSNWRGVGSMGPPGTGPSFVSLERDVSVNFGILVSMGS